MHEERGKGRKGHYSWFMRLIIYTHESVNPIFFECSSGQLRHGTENYHIFQSIA